MEKDFYKKEEISQIGRETTIQEDTKQIDNSSTRASTHSDKRYPDKHHSDEHWAQISNHIRKEIGDTVNVEIGVPRVCRWSISYGCALVNHLEREIPSS